MLDLSLVLIISLLLIGAFAGVFAGLLGIGGGFLMVPLQFQLLTSLGLPPGLSIKIATATSLATIIPTALSGAYGHYKNKTSKHRLGLKLGLFGLIGSILGAYTAIKISGELLTQLLAILLLIISIYMITNTQKRIQKPTTTTSSDETNIYPPYFIIIGLITGFLSGLLGIGGGIIIIPLLIYILGLSTKEAIGTSLFFIPITALGGVSSLIILPGTINAMPFMLGYLSIINLILMLICSIPLAYITSQLADKVSDKKLTYLFAVILFILAFKMIFS